MKTKCNNLAILITGIAGSGKSAVSDKLRAIGYKAYDIENIEGLFTMNDKITSRPFIDYDNNDFEKVKRGSWDCNYKEMVKLITANNNQTAFYCGTASNLDEIWPLFDRIFLLLANSAIIHQRLTDRTSNDFARTDEVQKWVLDWKDWWEQQMIEKGAIVIDANRPLVEVVDEVIKKSKS